MDNIFNKVFGKDTDIDSIFSELNKKIKELQENAEKGMMEYYNNAPPQEETKSARHILMNVLEEEPLECGCCYNIPRHAIDLIATELASQANTIIELQALCKDKETVSSKDILELIDKERRVLYTMTSGIRELIRAGRGVYESTMIGYSRLYRRNNPSDAPGVFDNILGMHVTIMKIINIHIKKAE